MKISQYGLLIGNVGVIDQETATSCAVSVFDYGFKLDAFHEACDRPTFVFCGHFFFTVLVLETSRSAFVMKHFACREKQDSPYTVVDMRTR